MAIRLRIEAESEDEGPTGISLDLDQPRIVVGRGASSDVRLPHPSVSTLHATIRQHGAGFAIIDERSTNGVVFAGARIAPERPKPLRSGDVLRIGPYRVTVTLGVAVPRATTSDEASSLARRLVLEPTAPRTLTFLNGPRRDERIVLPDAIAEWRIGRAEDAELLVDDAECSRHHATLLVGIDAVSVRDEGSKNGVLVQGRPATTRKLRDRDELTLGATAMLFEDPREAAVLEASRAPEDVPVPELPDDGPAEPLLARDDSAPSDDAAAAHADEGLDLVEPSPEAPPTREPRDPRPARSPADADRMADRFVYALAILVLAMSIGATVWLFGSR